MATPMALSVVLAGLTAGATSPVYVYARTSGADWTADAANTADLTGSIGVVRMTTGGQMRKPIRPPRPDPRRCARGRRVTVAARTRP